MRCSGTLLSCPVCGTAAQPVHDRLRRAWRHLDLFQFEAWLHADVPRVACGSCGGKTIQLGVPWARPGSGFTAAFEALALALCRELLVHQAAALLRCRDKQLWRSIEFYAGQARALERLQGVPIVGIDETSSKRGQHYITVVHGLDAKRLLFATGAGTTRRCGRRRRLEPFKRLAATIKERWDAVRRGMLEHRSNACLRGVDERSAPAGEASRANTERPRTSSPSPICASHA